MRYLILLLIIRLSNSELNLENLNNLKLCSRSHPKFNQCLKHAIEIAFDRLEKNPKFPSLQLINVPDFNVTSERFVNLQMTEIIMYRSPINLIEDVRLKISDSRLHLLIRLINPNTVIKLRFHIAAFNFISPKVNVTVTEDWYDAEISFSGEIVDDYATITDVNIKPFTKHIQIEVTTGPTVLDTLLNFLIQQFQTILSKYSTGYIKPAFEIAYKDLANTVFSSYKLSDLFPL